MTAICGMIGDWAQRPDAGAHLAAMLGALSSRPPAVWSDPEGRCRLGVAGGGQVIACGTLVAVCDGRLFDRAGAAGADARLIALWSREGERGLGRADAQFAFAAWDTRVRQLTLARDPLGVRSLYFHAGRGGVIFASTIEALLRHPDVPREVDERAVSGFLTFLNVPTPSTLFARIAKLPPGSFAVCGAGGIERVDRFWDLVDDPIPERDDPAHYVERARALHRDAVVSRMTDGPMAALLSGGNDSSANVALMARLGASPLHTFTVGMADFEGQDRYSDVVHARQVAALAGSQHHERLLSVDDFITAIPRVIDAQDDLVSEPSSVFLYHALEMVRDAGLDVVITGEANDEISCGHSGMTAISDGYYRRWRPLMWLPRVVRWLLAATAPVISPKHADVLARAADDGEYFWSYEVAWGDLDKAEILRRDAFERTRDAPASSIVAERARAIRRGEGKRDYLAHVIAMMMQDHYLGNLMLGKLERLSSRFGIEARCPYTAPDYVHFVFNIPSRFKTRDGQVKAFFKEAIGELLPREIIYRPKQGFRTPTPELFRGRFGDWARPILLESGLTRAGVLRQDTLATMLDEHRKGPRDLSTRLWTALVLNLWHDRWVRR
jgi:asparagine synthase (glutamine-hydrolysing)